MSVTRFLVVARSISSPFSSNGSKVTEPVIPLRSVPIFCSFNYCAFNVLSRSAVFTAAWQQHHSPRQQAAVIGAVPQFHPIFTRRDGRRFCFRYLPDGDVGDRRAFGCLEIGGGLMQ